MASTQDPKRRALGKGLESLLPSLAASREEPAGPPASPNGQPLEVPLDLIDRNPFQTRTRFDEAQLEELANSIAATGVVQPIMLRLQASGRYQLVTGERRLLASRKAGKTHIPAILRAISDEQAMEMTIVENLQRADLNPMEQARAYQRLAHDFKMTQEQMASRTGKERASVANFLRLLRLPEPIQDMVEAGEISFGHARALLALGSPEAMIAAAQKISVLSMSVRQTESYVQGLLNPEKKEEKSKSEPAQDPNVRAAQEHLQQLLGLKVRIEDVRGRGRVIVEYRGIEQFDALLNALSGK